MKGNRGGRISIAKRNRVMKGDRGGRVSIAKWSRVKKVAESGPAVSVIPTNVKQISLPDCQTKTLQCIRGLQRAPKL